MRKGLQRQPRCSERGAALTVLRSTEAGQPCGQKHAGMARQAQPRTAWDRQQGSRRHHDQHQHWGTAVSPPSAWAPACMTWLRHRPDEPMSRSSGILEAGQILLRGHQLCPAATAGARPSCRCLGCTTSLAQWQPATAGSPHLLQQRAQLQQVEQLQVPLGVRPVQHLAADPLPEAVDACKAQQPLCVDCPSEPVQAGTELVSGRAPWVRLGQIFSKATARADLPGSQARELGCAGRGDDRLLVAG